MQRTRGYGETVMHPEPLFASSDESGPPQVREVSRDRRLRQLDSLVKMANADLTPFQEAQEPQAHRIGVSLQKASRLFQGWRVQRLHTSKRI